MTNRRSQKVGFTAMALALLMCVSVLGENVPPDLTKGETNGVDRNNTYNLGPTGLRGWVYGRPPTHFDGQQGRITALSRQILVTHVGTNSPAEGVLMVDDVILGVGGKLFSEDARKSLGRAITDAEKKSNKGILTLIRWRAGKTEPVSITLRAIGSYSDTAPYGCVKSKQILEDACTVLEKEPLNDDLWGAVSGLALLASGKAEYLPRVREFARRMAAGELKREGGGAWDCGYKNVFLSEYFLLTGDKDVLPGIHALTVKLACGQGMYGTFGHGFSLPTPDGKLHGSIPPYGPVNQSGLIANLGIVLGKKCGVTDSEVDPAIARAKNFFAYFVDKGTVPYGEHEPFPFHENNGKSALAAVMFALEGNSPEAARFYAKMATAAYANREYGHTGQGFSYLWGALGANVGGPDAAAAFFKEAQWHLDLSRRCDGSFVYDGGEQYGAGRTDDNTYYGRSSYYGLSPAATYVLTYSLPLRKLYITGRGAPRQAWLGKRDVTAAIASGRFDLDRGKRNSEALIAAFGDWSPVVRGWAAEELARRPEAKGLEARLITMADGPDAHMRQGACETLGYMRSKAALPLFIRLLSHEDRWLRFKAAQAIKTMGGEAREAIPAILEAVAQTAEPADPIAWSDPIQLAHGQLAAALFTGPLEGDVSQADRKLLYPAIRTVANNPDGMARAKLRSFFEHQLSVDDVQTLAPDIFAAVKTPSPADRMFANEIRMGGFKALTKYHFVEGIDAGLEFARTQGGHGSESRTGEIMKEIMSYGSAARDAIPQLEALIADFNKQCKEGHFPGGELNDRRVNAVKEAITSIQAAEGHPELRRIGT